MAFRPDELATHLLSWRPRYDEGLTDWRTGAAGLPRRFADHLATCFPDRHLEDLQVSVDGFALSRRDLVDWYRAVLSPFEAALRFDDGAPRLRQGHLAAWRTTTALVDADALVTLALSSRPSRDEATTVVDGLPQWRYFVTTGDPGLERVLRRGLADTHVHFEASDPLALLWLRLASGEVPARDLAFFSDATLAGLSHDKREHRSRKEGRELMALAARLRDALSAHVGMRLERAGGREPAALLREERVLLLRAWRSAREGERRLDALAAIDRYLFVKNLFTQSHQQGAGRGPGLTRFRDYLDRGETIGERRRKKSRPAVRRGRFERMLSLATSHPDLRYVELRIAPQDTLKGWQDFLRLWDAAFADRPGPDVRFVVHFIRKSWPQGQGDFLEHGGLRAKLDRQTAVLQLLRHSRPDLARRIVGIDVANLERNFPPSVFSPYLRLLRDDVAVDRAATVQPLQRWRGLELRGLLRPPRALRRLGLTYHAGEDFHHPLTGLRDIAQLLRHAMHPGDRIGHGLALGLDIARIEGRRGHAPVPAGVLLDDLAWLRREASPRGTWTGTCQHVGDALIHDLCVDIYGGAPDRAALERSLDAPFGFVAAEEAPDEAPEIGLARRNLTDRNVSDRRRAFVGERQNEVLRSALPAMVDQQRNIARRVREAGITVETCPTSNLVTGAVGSLTDHPLFALLENLDQQCVATLNTDDPGVFGTTLDVEFALIFDAMLARGMSRPAALEALEASRRLAIDSAFSSVDDAWRSTCR